MDNEEANEALDAFDNWYSEFLLRSRGRRVIDRLSAREAWLACWKLRDEIEAEFSLSNRDEI